MFDSFVHDLEIKCNIINIGFDLKFRKIASNANFILENKRDKHFGMFHVIQVFNSKILDTFIFIKL